jgi:hypothetical protein
MMLQFLFSLLLVWTLVCVGPLSRPSLCWDWSYDIVACRRTFCNCVLAKGSDQSVKVTAIPP